MSVYFEGVTFQREKAKERLSGYEWGSIAELHMQHQAAKDYEHPKKLNKSSHHIQLMHNNNKDQNNFITVYKNGDFDTEN